MPSSCTLTEQNSSNSVTKLQTFPFYEAHELCLLLFLSLLPITCESGAAQAALCICRLKVQRLKKGYEIRDTGGGQ